MSKSFSQLRKNRNSRLQELNKAVDEEKTPSYKQNDDRFWKLTRDDAGNGSALIRFLDAPKDEDWAWVRYFDHGFQGPGGWFIEKSLTTIGKSDPVSELNRSLFQTGIKANEEQAREQKRRLHYVSNILVIKDPKNSDNDGKVFLFRYGKKIFELLQGVMSPETDELDPDNTPDEINPFCMWEGANLKLRVRMADKYPAYDKSSFEDCSAIFPKDDAQYEKLWESQHSLQDLISEDKFKTYEQLQARLNRVLGTGLPDVSRNVKAETSTITSATVEEVELDDAEDLGDSGDETEAEGLEFLEKLAADS